LLKVVLQRTPPVTNWVMLMMVNAQVAAVIAVVIHNAPK